MRGRKAPKKGKGGVGEGGQLKEGGSRRVVVDGNFVVVVVDCVEE